MVVLKLLQQGTENGMFGHRNGNSFVLVSWTSRFMDDEADCSVITRNGPILQVLKYIAVAVKNHALQPQVDREKDDQSLTECISSQGLWSPFSCYHLKDMWKKE